MMPSAYTSSPLSLFAPPYTNFVDLSTTQIPNCAWGDALFWRWGPASVVSPDELKALAGRHPAIPLFVILPPPETLRHILDLTSNVLGLRPAGVVPFLIDFPLDGARALLAERPPNLGVAVAEHLIRRAIPISQPARRMIEEVFLFSAEVKTVGRLSQRVALSRRSLGRIMRESELPPPSHWIQFARAMRAALRLQSESISIARVAAAGGYPDAFTFSNQVKRIYGMRPTEVRKRLGWRWLIEAWLAQWPRRRRG